MQEGTNNKTKQLIKTLGALINNHRKAQEKTTYKISAEAEVPKATWREVEIGLKDFRFTTLWEIADGLEIPLEKLIEELKTELGENFTLSD